MGGVFTPLAAVTLLLTADLAWPQADRDKESAEDVFLFLSGLAATEGVTNIAKGLISRPRPYMTLIPADQGERRGFRSDRSSFFSGHTSSAFFSAVYLNLRLRNIMRAVLTASEYDSWRWAPPTVLFGWATFVAGSRVQAYRHYPSDVVFGALAGYLVAELFYSWGRGSSEYSTSFSPPPHFYG